LLQLWAAVKTSEKVTVVIVERTMCNATMCLCKQEFDTFEIDLQGDVVLVPKTVLSPLAKKKMRHSSSLRVP